MKKNTKQILTAAAFLAGIYAGLKVIAHNRSENENINENNPYDTSSSCLEQNMIDGKEAFPTFYESAVKPILDQILSFVGLIVLSPLYGLISLMVYLDDPGPIFFEQKRVGKNKKFFMLHKFRSMKISAPHDIPTHQLVNPEKYITCVGKMLRKTSLDELPQIWDIFRGKMSIIGPRPALWNQDDLVRYRDQYSVNNVKPGLTGLAQIKGRDELLIPEKARLDGEYVRVLRAGGIHAFMQDAKCFIETVQSVMKHEGVVEGGIKENDGSLGEKDTRYDDYGHHKFFNINKTVQKKILITGAASYVGESFKCYAEKHYPALSIDTVDMVDSGWRNKSFHGYDCVFHVAGIAHADIGIVTEAKKREYYAVNTDLAIETAQKAKAEGVSQFIFMSSMIVYGESACYKKQKIIDEYTIPSPSNVYGDSKWRADRGVRELNSGSFYVAVLRPPMIYGKGSKGNYPVLSKLAKSLPVFPYVENSRSMLYIDNLCEFLCLLVFSGEGGIYFPQNSTYTNTSSMVQMIADEVRHPINVNKIFKPVVMIAAHIPGKISKLVNKAFGNIVYDSQISQYKGLDYQIYDLETSIALMEGE